MNIIDRNDYILRIEKQLSKEMIIVLTGQRRVGKSYLLKLLKLRLEQQKDANVIFIDMEKREFDAIKSYSELNDYIAIHCKKNKHTYILIDEVQDIAQFEKSLRSWYTEPNTDVIVTGSNAYMLSSELSTIIGGRYKEIYIQPLSYNDFLRFHNLPDSDDSLNLFINFGGMPSLRKVDLNNEDDVYGSLSDIVNTVLVKDVLMRNKIRNTVFLENILSFLADNIGKLISAHSVSKFMKSQGIAVSPALLIEYFKFLSDAFIINKVSRFDIHGKRIFESNDKFYFADHGIRNAIAGGNREGDIEKVLENIVYEQLIRSGYKVYVGQLRAGEIDFVCEKTTTRAYVQVAYIIADDVTRIREFGNLQSIPDNYPKFVISLTPSLSTTNFAGIKHLHLRKFLSSGLDA